MDVEDPARNLIIRTTGLVGTLNVTTRRNPAVGNVNDTLCPHRSRDAIAATGRCTNYNRTSTHARWPRRAGRPLHTNSGRAGYTGRPLNSYTRRALWPLRAAFSCPSTARVRDVEAKNINHKVNRRTGMIQQAGSRGHRKRLTVWGTELNDPLLYLRVIGATPPKPTSEGSIRVNQCRFSDREDTGIRVSRRIVLSNPHHKRNRLLHPVRVCDIPILGQRIQFTPIGNRAGVGFWKARRRNRIRP